MIDEMEILLADKEVEINNKKVVVTRYSFMDTLKLASKTSGFVIKLMENAELTSGALSKIMIESEDSAVIGVRLIGMMELLTLLGDSGVDFVHDCIKFATVLTEEEIASLDPDAGIDLLMTIYGVNKGFFMKCMNKLKVILPKVEEKKAKKTKSK